VKIIPSIEWVGVTHEHLNSNLKAEAERRANTKQPQFEQQQCIKVAVMSKYSPQLQSELVGSDDSNENSTVMDTMLKAYL
jgi:hypothetical protein